MLRNTNFIAVLLVTALIGGNTSFAGELSCQPGQNIRRACNAYCDGKIQPLKDDLDRCIHVGRQLNADYEACAAENDVIKGRCQMALDKADAAF